MPRGRKTTHGGTYTRLFRVWVNMIARCEKPRVRMFHRYGGRGIRVCDEWHDFAIFRSWAEANGYTAKLTIDRVDNDLGYYPANCRWATQFVQVANRSNASRYGVGVSLYTGPRGESFIARIKKNGRFRYLGTFPTAAQASAAYFAAAEVIHGVTEVAKIREIGA